MNTVTFNPTTAEDQQLVDLVEEITNRLQAGESCDIDEYVQHYPEYADRLRDWIGVMTAMADFGRSLALRSPRQSAGDSQSADQNPQSEIHAAPGILGDFRIVRELGRGGMGVVYEAEQISLGRRVALKVLPFAAMLDKQQLARFKNEARAAATLDHPNIVAIHSVGAERGVHYYAMQLIEGQSLAECIAAMKPGRPPSDEPAAPPAALNNNPAAGDTAKAALPTLRTSGGAAFFRTVAQLGIQAAEALDHAHQNGILHRDIKPANLLVDDTGKLWITDFGLARIEQDAGMTMTGDLLGTLRYMSPEQALAKRIVVDHRSDIYSLGVTLYELLTLQPVFGAEDRHELLRQIAFDEPGKPRQINPRIPQDLETIVLKAIEKNPADRFATAQDLADDLERFLNCIPIVARPITQWQRFCRWVNRNTLVAALLSAIAALSLAVAAIATAGYLRTQSALQKAVAAEAQASEEAEVAAAVNSFLQEDLLGLAGATEQIEAGIEPDPELKLPTLLERAVTKIDQRFANRPRVRAELQDTLAKSFRGISRYQEAVRLWEQVYKYREKTLGSEHPKTLATLFDIASAYSDAGEHSKSIERHDYVLALRQKVLGEDHPDTLESLQAVIFKQVHKGDLDVAIAMQDRVLQQMRRVFGPEHPKTLASMNCLAVAYRSAGKNAKAIALHEETLKLHQNVFGDEDPRTLNVMNWLAAEYFDADQPDKAIPLWESSLESSRRVLGPRHNLTFAPMAELANCYYAYGHHQKAVPLFEELVELGTQIWDNEHNLTLTSRENLARSYCCVARFDEAIAVQEKTIELVRQAFGPDHLSVFRSKEVLGDVYWEAGEFEKAQGIFREILEWRTKRLGESHDHTLRAMRLLVMSCRSAGHIEQADTLGEQLVNLCRQKETMNQHQFAVAISELAATRLKQERYSEAEALLRDSLKTLSPNGEIDQWALAAMYRLGAALRAQQKFAEAEALLVKAWTMLDGSDLRRLSHDARAELAQLYRDCNKPAEVARLLSDNSMSAVAHEEPQRSNGSR